MKNLIRRPLTLIIISLLLVIAHKAQDPPASKNLPNLHKVNNALYRGGQPKKDGFAELKKMGIATVIDLRDDDDKASEEKGLVERLGMRFINKPLSGWTRPNTDEIDAILKEVNASENQPVFVHCKRGKDRTGTVIAIYRMVHDRWTAKQANDEAEKYGIGWWEIGMRDFINDYYRDHVEKK